MRKIAEVIRPHGRHWVGNGFPVRTLFSYGGDSAAVSPFLLFDYAGPHVFEPSTAPRGAGQHPHRGFETVTIVYGTARSRTGIRPARAESLVLVMCSG